MPSHEHEAAVHAGDVHARDPGARPRRVINATGVVLHSELGGSPLSLTAREAVVEASGYSAWGFDPDTGRPTPPALHAGARLAHLCRTEAATVVNNGAAAVTLALATLAGGQEAVVSRGELVELGDAFRIPETAAAAGAGLVEVGTTNRTRLDDYRVALTTRTGLLLKVHPVGFVMTGATEQVAVADLVQLGRDAGIPVVHVIDAGLLDPDLFDPALLHEGELDEVAADRLAAEPSVATSMADGVDLVVFSANQLVGGPPAGVLAGRADLVLRCTRHPFARAVEPDRLRLAALEATIDAHERASVPVDLPTVAMLATATTSLRQRAEWMAEQLGDASAVPVTASIGSGVLPDVELPSWAVALPAADAARLAARLRASSPPVIAREADGQLLLDLRTVPPSQDADLVDLVLDALV